MNNIIRGCMLAMLAFLIIAGTGCGKKKLDVDGSGMSNDAGYNSYDNGYGKEESPFSPEESAAATEITSGTLYFEYDSFELHANAKSLLSQKAQIMKQFPQLRVVIEGHCDERGTEEYNLALGERRARAAFDYLVNLGISPERMEVLSLGKLHPATSGTGENSWEKNRRDEFKVTKTKG